MKSDTPQRSSVVCLDRRRFLQYTGITTGHFILASSLPFSEGIHAAPQMDHQELNVFISIGKDNQVYIVCHRSEMGQGIRTGVPQVIAEELCADWATVHVKQALADQRYGSQNTDGSRSIRRDYTKLRELGASARWMLEEAAATRWKIPHAEVYAQSGRVYRRRSSVLESADKQSFEFGELAEYTAQFPVPEKDQIQLKNVSDFQIIGKSMPIVDQTDMLSGQAVYGQDVHVEGMLIASIERCPVTGGKIKQWNQQEAMEVPGVVQVVAMPEQSLPARFKPINGVAVIATNTWAAMQGRKALVIDWDYGVHQEHDSTLYLEKLKTRVRSPGEPIRSLGSPYEIASSAAKKHVAGYSVPYLAHAPMETPSATAIVNNNGCEIWACTQAPQRLQKAVAQTLGIEEQQVKVHVTLLGGGFGRKSKPDYAVEAAFLAAQTGSPVKVIWSREDDIRMGYYHAVSAQYFQATFDDKNQITSWIQRTAFPSLKWTFDGKTQRPSESELSLGFGDMPFQIDHLSCETHEATAHTRIGWLRSVSNIQHAFALGSFVDELAVFSGKPTEQMWHELLGVDSYVDVSSQEFNFSNYGQSLSEHPVDISRFKKVLGEVVEQSQMNEGVDQNQGWGLSVHRSFLSYAASAIRVEIIDKKVSVLEVHIALDAGQIINPDRVRSQLEGSVIFGLSLALMGEIDIQGGAVQSSNFHDYPVLRIDQCKEIYTHIINSNAPPGGVGEAGVPPVSASLTNAIYHASGLRIRDLPVNKHLRV